PEPGSEGDAHQSGPSRREGATLFRDVRGRPQRRRPVGSLHRAATAGGGYGPRGAASGAALRPGACNLMSRPQEDIEMASEVARDEPRSLERPRDALARIDAALRGLRYGTVTAVVQDGVVVQVERTEKFRLERRERSR